MDRRRPYRGKNACVPPFFSVNQPVKIEPILVGVGSGPYVEPAVTSLVSGLTVPPWASRVTTMGTMPLFPPPDVEPQPVIRNASSNRRAIVIEIFFLLILLFPFFIGDIGI
jgi:hypothetical protein